MALTFTMLFIGILIGLKSVFCIVNTSEPINVILLTYHRSGSSFIGELLSANDQASYYFEPLYHLAVTLNDSTPKQQRKLMTDLLTCDRNTLDTLQHSSLWIIRKFAPKISVDLPSKYSAEQLQDLCQQSGIHVTKTIRLRLKNAIQLLDDATIPNLRIIHLVRDPRARFNSAQANNISWSKQERSINVICGEMERDLQIVEKKYPSNYMLVKYEDMVANISAFAYEIYNNIFGLNVTKDVKKFILTHTRAEINPTYQLHSSEYYSTFRQSNFSVNHWQHELNPQVIDLIQQNSKCKYVLERLNYPIFQLGN